MLSEDSVIDKITFWWNISDQINLLINLKCGFDGVGWSLTFCRQAVEGSKGTISQRKVHQGTNSSSHMAEHPFVSEQLDQPCVTPGECGPEIPRAAMRDVKCHSAHYHITVCICVCPQSYSMAVYLVKQQSSTVLLQRLRAKGIRNPDHSRALSKDVSHCFIDQIHWIDIRAHVYLTKPNIGLC